MRTRTLQDQFLIVSHPPHGARDVRAAAPCIGLTLAQMRLKANYPVPEIWVADRSRIRIAATAQTLRLAGHNVAVVRGRELLLPPQTGVETFCFGEPGLVVSLSDGSEVEIPYDAPIAGVLCTPRCPTEVNGSRDGSGLARTIEPGSAEQDIRPGRDRSGQPSSTDRPAGHGQNGRSAFLDLWVPSSTGIIRVTFLQNRSNFTGLGSLATDRTADNLMVLVRECEKRLVNLRLDRRLENLLPRRPVTGDTPAGYAVLRKGYSFASGGLPRLLGGIAPGLEELSQFELSSRLAYLTVQQNNPIQSRAA